MRRFAIVQNGKVKNIAISDEPLSLNWIESATAKKGDDYDAQTGEFSTPQTTRQPRKVSLYQLKVALDNNGLLDQADTLVATLPKRWQLFWQYGLEVEPTRQMAQNLASGLGITGQQMKAIFLEAMQISD